MPESAKVMPTGAIEKRMARAGRNMRSRRGDEAEHVQSCQKSASLRRRLPGNQFAIPISFKLFETFTFSEKHGQGVPWVLVCPNETMRHFQRTEKLFVCGHEGVETCEIFFTSGLGMYGATGTGLG